MINTLDSRFEQHPESLNGVRVYVPHDVDLGTVMDTPMRIASIHMRDAVIADEFIGKHHRTRHDVLFHHP